MKTSFGPITVDSIGSSLKKGTEQAQLRQVITKVYDGVKANTSLSDSLFDNADIADPKEPYTETRMFWQLVKTGTTVAQVEAQIAKFPKARIRRILSFSPIVSEETQNVLDRGLTGDALVSFCEKHELGEKTEWDNDCKSAFYNNIKGNQTVRTADGEIVPYEGQTQYKLNVLSLEGAEDIDMRKKAVVNAESIQLTEEVVAEVTEKVN